jgi:hypothetical protein
MSQASSGLLSRQSLGGILARKGFQFQDLWLLQQVCTWLVDPQFRGVMNEGMDDIDVFWLGDDKYPGRQERYQLKDQSVDGTTLLNFLARSEAAHASTKGEWYCFWLIASRSIQSLESLPGRLARVQQARLPYGDQSATYLQSMDSLREDFAKIGECPTIEFVIQRVRFNLSVGNLVDSELFWEGLNWRLVENLQIDRVEQLMRHMRY